MTTDTTHALKSIPLDRVKITSPFWDRRLAANRDVTIPVVQAHLQTTGRIDAFRLDWNPGDLQMPHHFWDSDVAKWIEATGYSLQTHPDPELEAEVDRIIDLIAGAQQDDGYLNVHFTVAEPENRWRNLRDMHELYCAGHLMEAAVAYYEGTGKRKLLDVMCRYADHIATVFGAGPDQKRGYAGHEEIELALVKLYRATGKRRYLELAKFFVDERGREPFYFDLEAQARGEDPAQLRARGHAYCQSHLPVREQTTAEGHAVRAVYLYAGMADVAAETGDADLVRACTRLWQNVTQRRMYVTGGIGSSSLGERFTTDHDLPNGLAYAETCAAIGLAFWAHRMLRLSPDAGYADVMERALYNGALSGLALAGDKFFYANPLEAQPAAFEWHPHAYREPAVSPRRKNWFGCSCCPTNIVRTLASLGRYVASVGDTSVYVHLYVDGDIETELDRQLVTLHQETCYPWDGNVRISVDCSQESDFTLALRIPGWCREATLRINDQLIPVDRILDNGYAKIDRTWHTDDVVELTLEMLVERIRCHPSVRANAGRVALQRGPLVYCLEEVDNGPNLDGIVLPMGADLTARFDGDLLQGVVVIAGEGLCRDASDWGNRLYGTGTPADRIAMIKAIPYYAWANRDPGEMLVWIREA